MDLDMELVYGDEDYEDIQEYFESRKYVYPSGSSSMQERLKREYVPEVWEDLDEEDKISNRQCAIRGICNLLQEVSSDIKKSSVSETSSEGQK